MYLPIGPTSTTPTRPAARPPRRAEADDGASADRDAEGFYGGDGGKRRRDEDGRKTGSTSGDRESGAAIRAIGPGGLDVTV